MPEGRTFNIYAVKDELVGRFLSPIFIESDPEAIRWFGHVLNHTEMWKENPNMFSLYKLGTFNEGSGETTSKVEMIQGGQAVYKKEE